MTIGCERSPFERSTHRVEADVDFDRDGHWESAIRVTGSAEDGGPLEVRIPVTVLRNGSGPTVLFFGGNHGDEFEGPVALWKLARSLDPSEIRGRVVVVPVLNPPALLASSRNSPVDGKNMNRVFPGNAAGTVTEVVADFVVRELLPRADAVFDLHAGGRASFIIPSLMVHALPDEDLMARTVAAMKAFRAPVGIVIKEYETEGMLDTAVETRGKVFGCAELGGGGVLTPESVGVAETGVRNVLKHFGVIGGEPETPVWRGRREARVLEALEDDCYVKSAEAGVFEPFVEIGEPVEAGRPLGQIHHLDREQAPEAQMAKRSGELFLRHAPGRIAKGDTIAIVAQKTTRW